MPRRKICEPFHDSSALPQHPKKKGYPIYEHVKIRVKILTIQMPGQGLKLTGARKEKSQQKGIAERCLPHNKGAYEVDYNLEELGFICFKRAF